MGRPRSKSKPRWTSRRFTAGFVEDYRGGGTAYVRIGDWRKSLAPLRFVPANRARAVAILERMIELRAYTVPPSRVQISADGTVEVLAHVSGRIASVQFHPEGAPGPIDAARVFDLALAGALG